MTFFLISINLSQDHINVNCVLPGAANTPFTTKVLSSKEKVDYVIERIPLNRLAEPEDFVGGCMVSVGAWVLVGAWCRCLLGRWWLHGVGTNI